MGSLRTTRSRRAWYLLSSHGILLFYITAHPGCTIREMSESLFLTSRTVWGIVGDLRAADMVRVEREGRRHHYHINPDARLKHPLWQGLTIREMATQLAERANRVTRPYSPRDSLTH